MEFSDLQRSWSDRFPQEKLSLVFKEDDIKTLLATHKARVVQLRKELAQEEFLVEHFERALDDERQRRQSVTSDESRSPTLSRENSMKEAKPDGMLDPESFVTVIAVSSQDEEVRCSRKKPPAPPPKRVAAKWPPASMVNSLGAPMEEVPSPTLSTFGKPVQTPPVQSPTNASSFQLALSNFRQVSTEPSPVDKTPKPAERQSTFVSSPSELSSQSKSNDSSLERNTNTVQSTDSSLERKSVLSIGSPANRPDSALIIERSDSFRLQRNASNASSHGRSSDMEDYRKSSLKKDLPSLEGMLPSHRQLEKTSTLSSNDSSFDGLDDPPIYDTVAADEDDFEVRCHSEQDYVEFGGYGRIPASLVTDSTEDDSDAEELPRQRVKTADRNLARSQQLLDKFKSCEDLRMSSILTGDVKLPTRKPPPIPGKPEIGAPQIPLRRGKSEERLDGDSVSGVYSSSMESYLSSKTSPQFRPKKSKESSEDENLGKQMRITHGSDSLVDDEINDNVRRIIKSTIESESAYVEGLAVLHQYGKALSSATQTNQTVLSRDDIDVIFFKIEELLELHTSFRDGLQRNIEGQSLRNQNHSNETVRSIGENFKFLESRLEVYKQFLQNYPNAVETVRRCSITNKRFGDLANHIKLKPQGQYTKLEVLLHKPVARFQKNGLIIDDLLRAFTVKHADYMNLKTASKLHQKFLDELKKNFTLESMFPLQDRVTRHVVRNVFMVQWDGRRKLRHLFLFNDVLVCAKCKTNNGGRFLEVKWFIPLNEVVLNDPEAKNDPIVEPHPVKTTLLKSRAAAVREQIWKLERKQGPTGCQLGVSGTSRAVEKLKRKFSDLEAALMLHLPELPLRIGHKSNKAFYFFVSSDFERKQWIEAITALQQQNITSSSPSPPTLYELNTCIMNAGKSTLSNRVAEKQILIGELRLRSIRLQGGESFPNAAIHISFEVDSYGHFFLEGRTRTAKIVDNEAVFDDEISLLLEGSQTLRILFYENAPLGACLRGKATFELTGSSSPLDEYVERSISLLEHTLSLEMKFLPENGVISADPDSKLVGNFGMKIEQVCRREKLKVPFLISCCIREVERRGLREVGIYRISGSSSDVQKLRKAFESDPHEAQYIVRNVDINAVAHVLKLYLRELPEGLFIDKLYPAFFEALSTNDPEEKSSRLMDLFQKLPDCNRAIINRLIDHMITVNKKEEDNKMSINNLATVFAPTLIRPPSAGSNDRDLLTTGTVDVMAQASILHFFLKRRQSDPEEVSHI